MAAGHGWGGASRTGFKPPRVGSCHVKASQPSPPPYPILSKEGSIFSDLRHCV
jgi:hypothetical protein